MDWVAVSATIPCFSKRKDASGFFIRKGCYSALCSPSEERVYLVLRDLVCGATKNWLYVFVTVRGSCPTKRGMIQMAILFRQHLLRFLCVAFSVGRGDPKISGAGTERMIRCETPGSE